MSILHECRELERSSDGIIIGPDEHESNRLLFHQRGKPFIFWIEIDCINFYLNIRCAMRNKCTSSFTSGMIVPLGLGLVLPFVYQMGNVRITYIKGNFSLGD
jgi:hypothetical protein